MSTQSKRRLSNADEEGQVYEQIRSNEECPRPGPGPVVRHMSMKLKPVENRFLSARCLHGTDSREPNIWEGDRRSSSNSSSDTLWFSCQIRLVNQNHGPVTMFLYALNHDPDSHDSGTQFVVLLAPTQRDGRHSSRCLRRLWVPD